MQAVDFLALLKAAGLPDGLPLREVDRWVGDQMQVSERQARKWRLTGHVPQVVLLALRGMAQPTTF
jgi:hypothetical protein